MNQNLRPLQFTFYIIDDYIFTDDIKIYHLFENIFTLLNNEILNNCIFEEPEKHDFNWIHYYKFTKIVCSGYETLDSKPSNKFTCKIYDPTRGDTNDMLYDLLRYDYRSTMFFGSGYDIKCFSDILDTIKITDEKNPQIVLDEDGYDDNTPVNANDFIRTYNEKSDMNENSSDEENFDDYGLILINDKSQSNSTLPKYTDISHCLIFFEGELRDQNSTEKFSTMLLDVFNNIILKLE